MSDFLSKSYEELDQNEQKAVEAARKAINNSYSPYSKFSVGAALVLDNGQIISGSNQENMAYPSGICAERTALFTYGSSNNDSFIRILAIVARRHNTQNLVSATPCGACRQVMLEYELKQSKPFSVIFYHDNKYIVASNSKSLLPFHFHLESTNE